LKRLGGQHCIVLRAAPEGVALCEALRSLELEVLHFPSMEIHPVAAPRLPAEPPDLLIFISQNAVRHGAAALAAAPSARLAAIGAGTAAALVALGRQVDIMPAGSHDSEALLAAPALCGHFAGRRIWCVRGGPGRALLGDTLVERGAHVHYVEVYERLLPRPDPVDAALAAAWLTGEPPAWLVATSVESLGNLQRLLRERPLVYRLVTASDRVVQLAEQRDKVLLVLRAEAPDPASLARCLQQWAAGHPDRDTQ
jgi:uroporphyrinogen-III synthase